MDLIIWSTQVNITSYQKIFFAYVDFRYLWELFFLIFITVPLDFPVNVFQSIICCTAFLLSTCEDSTTDKKCLILVHSIYYRHILPCTAWLWETNYTHKIILNWKSRFPSSIGINRLGCEENQQLAYPIH